MFVIAAVGNFIAMLDSTTVNLALYPMSVALHVTMSQIQWVMIAYMLVLTVFLPFFGKLGDIFPKNKLYALGFSIFALGAFLNTTENNNTNKRAIKNKTKQKNKKNHKKTI